MEPWTSCWASCLSERWKQARKAGVKTLFTDLIHYIWGSTERNAEALRLCWDGDLWFVWSLFHDLHDVFLWNAFPLHSSGTSTPPKISWEVLKSWCPMAWLIKWSETIRKACRPCSIGWASFPKMWLALLLWASWPTTLGIATWSLNLRLILMTHVTSCAASLTTKDADCEVSLMPALGVSNLAKKKSWNSHYLIYLESHLLVARLFHCFARWPLFIIRGLQKDTEEGGYIKVLNPTIGNKSIMNRSYTKNIHLSNHSKSELTKLEGTGINQRTL